jgi:hypothetical protein
VILIDDVLVVVEAKAGVAAMDSPAVNFGRHVRAIQDLVLKAYDQCARFLAYLDSKQTAMPLYRLVDGNYVEIERIKLGAYRIVLPIGLTVEAFTPFSAMCKELPNIVPILARYPFISMSIDDLFVVDRIMESCGEWLHYMEVRQQVAGIRRAMLYDELDHLGAYISKNRFDDTIREQQLEADFVTWDSFSDVIDRYFEEDRWQTERPPRQAYPQTVEDLLQALERWSGSGWLKSNSHIRNLNDSGRAKLARMIDELSPTLREFPFRRFLLDGEGAMQVWICREGVRPTPAEIVREGEIACLVSNRPSLPVVLLSVSAAGKITGASTVTAKSPPSIRQDYFALKAEAQRQRERYVPLNRPGVRRGKRKDTRR